MTPPARPGTELPRGRRADAVLTLLEGTTEAIVWEWDIHRDEVSCSDRSVAALGLPRDVHPLRLSHLLASRAPAARQDLKAQLLDEIAVADGQHASRLECELDLVVDAQIRRHLLRATVLTDPTGRPTHLMVVEVDITRSVHLTSELRNQHRELERRLLEAERRGAALEDYLAVLAHDLRSPLHSLANFAALANSTWGEAAPADARTMLRYLQTEAQRSADMVDELLAFASVGADALTLAPVPLNALVLQSWDSLDRPDDAALACDELPTVRADKRLLLRFFDNVLGNAVKYRAARPLRVSVSAKRIGPLWRLAIHDNGVGMPAGEHASAFDLFRRLTTSGEGSGLGLAIARRVIEAHQGEVWALPAADNGGTSVFFTLPVR